MKLSEFFFIFSVVCIAPHLQAKHAIIFCFLFSFTGLILDLVFDL